MQVKRNTDYTCIYCRPTKARPIVSPPAHCIINELPQWGCPICGMNYRSDVVRYTITMAARLPSIHGGSYDDIVKVIMEEGFRCG